MRIVIKNARIIDGNGGVLENGFTQFDETGILAISDKPIVGGTEIDATGKTVMPGLFDCHVHIGEMPATDVGDHFTAKNETQTAVISVTQSQEFLKFGITTI